MIKRQHEQKLPDRSKNLIRTIIKKGLLTGHLANLRGLHERKLHGMSYLFLVQFFLEVFYKSLHSFHKLRFLHLFHQLACYKNKLKAKENMTLIY